MARVKCLLGQKFNRLTVVSRAENSNAGKSRWNCICECGNSTTTVGSDLTNGHTKSCGCFKNENISKLGIECNTKHGLSHTRIYKIWKGLKRRCNNKNTPNYKMYGGRGILYCKEWEDFETFYKWAMDNGYREDLTIDRINNNGNYEPSNCRWATVEVQNNNKRNNRFLTYEGKTQTVSQWSKELKIPLSTLRYKINEGYSLEEIFEEGENGG